MSDGILIDEELEEAWLDDEFGEDNDIPTEFKENTSKTWESIDFRRLVERLTDNDDRFIGIFKFLTSVRFCWSYQIPTACAGHGFIFFNPDWYDSLPEEAHKTVIYHEAMHLILRHLQRGEHCDPYVHNIACDHVINLDAEAHGFSFVGLEELYKDSQFIGKSSEEVYDILMKGNKYVPLDIDFKNHIDRELIDQLIENMLANDPLTLDEQKDFAEHKVKEYADPGVGNMAGFIGLQFDLMKRKVAIQGATYPEIFKKQMKEPETKGRRTYKRPSRRMATSKTQPFVLPGRIKRKGQENRLQHLFYCLDVSGSISTAQGRQFNDSAQTVKKLLNPVKMTVIFWDTAIRHIQTFTDQEPYKRIKVRAGGGTDLRPVYTELAKHDPDCVVIYTDLCVKIPPEPDWDTIWLLTSENDTVPETLYGDVYICPPTKENS